jgi:hypothetical protein
MTYSTKTPNIIVCSMKPSVSEEGLLRGARLTSRISNPDIYFADQDWKNPNLDKYVRLVAAYKPYTATVIDYEDHVSFDTVWKWCEAVAPYVQQIIVIPKVSGTIDEIPVTCNGVEVILGFSIPTKYAGTFVNPKEFYGRKVHLLGGSPRKQIQFFIDHYQYMNIVSLDNNYVQMKANKFVEYWSYSSVFPLRSKWLHNSGSKETVKQRTDDAFRMSLINFRDYWIELGDQLWCTL